MEPTIQKISDTEVEITTPVTETVQISDLADAVTQAQKDVDDFEVWVTAERQARASRLKDAQDISGRVATANIAQAI